MSHLSTDQYTHVDRDCPVTVDVHPADQDVEIALGGRRVDGDTLRLIVDHPDTCLRLAAAIHDARDKLIAIRDEPAVAASR
jgi:hypothetical protein